MITGIEIRKIRDKLEMSQGEFGAKFGVKGNAVSHWECGINNPNEYTVKKLEILAVQLKKGIVRQWGERRQAQ